MRVMLMKKEVGILFVEVLFFMAVAPDLYPALSFGIEIGMMLVQIEAL